MYRVVGFVVVGGNGQRPEVKGDRRSTGRCHSRSDTQTVTACHGAIECDDLGTDQLQPTCRYDISEHRIIDDAFSQVDRDDIGKVFADQGLIARTFVELLAVQNLVNGGVFDAGRCVILKPARRNPVDRHVSGVALEGVVFGHGGGVCQRFARAHTIGHQQIVGDDDHVVPGCRVKRRDRAFNRAIGQSQPAWCEDIGVDRRWVIGHRIARAVGDRQVQPGTTRGNFEPGWQGVGDVDVERTVRRPARVFDDNRETDKIACIDVLDIGVNRCRIKRVRADRAAETRAGCAGVGEGHRTGGRIERRVAVGRCEGDDTFGNLKHRFGIFELCNRRRVDCIAETVDLERGRLVRQQKVGREHRIDHRHREHDLDLDRPPRIDFKIGEIERDAVVRAVDGQYRCAAAVGQERVARAELRFARCGRGRVADRVESRHLRRVEDILWQVVDKA